MSHSREKYEEMDFENRVVRIFNLLDETSNLPPLLFIIQDGEMFRQVQNNFLGKLEENISNALIVSVDTNNREGDYTPWFAERTVDWVGDFLGNGDGYIKFLLDDLIPKFENYYRVNFNQKNTFIAGASLGGLISTYAVFQYPSSFGGGIFVSSSFWYQGLLEFLNDKEDVNKNAIIYMDVGDQEGVGKITRGKNIVDETKKVYSIFLDKGIKKENIYFKIQKNMNHNTSFFVDRIYDGIIYIHKIYTK